LWWPRLMKDMQGSGMTDTEHSTTSGSNEIVIVVVGCELNLGQ